MSSHVLVNADPLVINGLSIYERGDELSVSGHAISRHMTQHIYFEIRFQSSCIPFTIYELCAMIAPKYIVSLGYSSMSLC